MQNLYLNSNYTCELIADPILFWNDKIKMDIALEFGPFNQIFQELLNTSSNLYNSNQNNVFLIRLEDWCYNNDKVEQEKTVDEFILAVNYYLKFSKADLFIVFTANSPEIIKDKNITLWTNQLTKKIKQNFLEISTIHILDSDDIDGFYKIEDYYDELGFKLAQIPYKKEYFVSIATVLIRAIFCIQNLKFKAIAVDCDNTLWQGIVGEDGIDGIAFTEGNLLLQQRLIDLYHAGMLICLCSKNNEDDVFEVLEKRKECIIKREHILYYRINWLPKSTNVLSLASEINIGADSFLFLDDNPMECDEVQTNTPATVFEYPNNEIERINFIKNNWAFYKYKITAEDQKKKSIISGRKKQEFFLKNAVSIQDFIQNLNLQIEIHQLSDNEISRVSQLTLRTNQFNFTTIRLNEESVGSYRNNENSICLTAHVSDRFGDYGLVGACFCKLLPELLLVENFLLSCRALGKGVEHKLLSEIGKMATHSGKNKICLDFIPSSKNKPAANFWNEIVNLTADESVCKNDQNCFVDSKVLSNFTYSITNSEAKEVELPDNKTVSGDMPSILTGEQLKLILSFSTIDDIIKGVYPSAAILPLSGNLEKQSKSDIEKILIDIWKRNIKTDQIQVSDNYFDLGGKSVFIPMIILEIKKHTGIELRMADFFNYPSIRLLTEFIYKGIGSKSGIIVRSDIVASKILAQKQRDKFRNTRIK